MPGRIDAHLSELGIALPATSAPMANYVPTVQSGRLVFVSGQLPLENGQAKYIGRLGSAITIEDGQKAARLCALNIMAQLKTACGGNLDRVKRCVRVGGFVNSTPEFTDQPQVVNGASDAIVAVFGEAGKHARAAVGVAALPRGVCVEVEAVFEIE